MIKSTIYLTHNEIKKIINSNEGLTIELYQEKEDGLDKKAEKLLINIAQLPQEV